MKTMIKALFASVAVVGLLSSCGGDNKLTLPKAPTDVTLPGGDTLPSIPSELSIPPDFTIPPGATFPSNVSIPTAIIDQMITQFEAAGMKVDRPCLENLLKDEDLRKLVESASTPSAEVIAKFMTCFKA
jgi:hypothetical protein